MRRYVIKPLKLIGVLIFVYSVLLIIVYIPKSAKLIEHTVAAGKIIDDEGDHRTPVLAYPGDIQLDNVTDRIMLSKAQGNANFSPIRNAFSGYARYWHGYLVLLRPLLMLFSYRSIRYLSLFHITLLMFGAAVMLSKKLGTHFTFLFGFVLCMCNYNIFPYSLQFSSIFYVMLYAVLIIMILDKRLLNNNNEWYIYTFLAIGSITNYVDFLTAPLLTLGIPLTLCYILRNKYLEQTYISNLRYLFIGSLYWGAGYASTWISKWILTYIIDSNAIIVSVSQAARLRLIGGEYEGRYYPLDRIQMLSANISSMYPPVLIILLVIIILALLLFIIRHHKPASRIYSMSPVLFLCVYPYIWYMVMAHHSQAHNFFTYRIQAITIFAFGAFLLSCLPDNFTCFKNTWILWTCDPRSGLEPDPTNRIK